MEWWILLLGIVGYSSISSKLDKIMNNMSTNKKKKFSSLQELIGKNIKLETDNQLELAYNCKTEGILKEYNDTWLVIETIDKKNKKELYYYRLNNVKSINEIEDKKS
jgi:hypothetical protein